MKRTVVNGRTIGTRAVTAAVLGLVGLLGYSAIRFIGGAMDRRETRKQAEVVEAQLQQHIAVVEEALAAKNFPQAQAAFEALDDANVLPPEREAILQVTLEQAVQQHRREIALQPFSAALARYDLTAAAEALAAVEQSGLHTPAKIAELRGEISSLRDEGKVYFQLIAKTPVERRGMITHYFSQFPDGAHAPEVRTVLFIDRLEGIIAMLQQGKEFPQVLTECEELTALAGQYRTSGIMLPAQYSLKLLEDTIAAYPSSGEVMEQTPKGTLLRVRRAPQNVDLKWNSNYRAQRDATIPMGSIGKNLGYLPGEGGDAQWLVQFDGIGRGAWRERWGNISDYWKDNVNNVAGYRKEELEPTPFLTPAERFAAEQAFKRLTEALPPYFQPPTQSSPVAIATVDPEVHRDQ